MDATMIGILVSLKKEVEVFLQALVERRRRKIAGCTLWEGSFRGTPVRIVLTGVGTELAPETLEGCRVILSTGFCGALKPDMKSGDLVLSREVTRAGEELLERITSPRGASGPFKGAGLFRLRLADQIRAHLLETARRGGLTLHEGRSVSCARVIRNRTEKRRIGGYFDAHAVDMEDYQRIGRVKRMGIEALCVRAVLDELEDDVPSFRRGVKLKGAVSLYLKIPQVQRSLGLLLEETVPYLADTMEIV